MGNIWRVHEKQKGLFCNNDILDLYDRTTPQFMLRPLTVRPAIDPSATRRL
jgi:hypothetical protein